jgi:hypothetical protein
MILEALYYCCCFGWKKTKEEEKILNRIKEDVVALTEEELNHLRSFLLKPTKRNLSCC